MGTNQSQSVRSSTGFHYRNDMFIQTLWNYHVKDMHAFTQHIMYALFHAWVAPVEIEPLTLKDLEPHPAHDATEMVCSVCFDSDSSS